MKNYYTTLGVSQDASFLEIRKAYLTLSKKIHPDKNNESGATEKFKEINEAYEVLSDPEKRKAFQNKFSKMQRQKEFQRQQWELQRLQEMQRQQELAKQRVLHMQKQQELQRQWELRRQQEIKKELKRQQDIQRQQEMQMQQELQKQQFLHMQKQMQKQQELKQQQELKLIQEAFMEAAKTGNLDACKYMIEKVKNVCDSADEEKTTALHYAAENGHLQVK